MRSNDHHLRPLSAILLIPSGWVLWPRHPLIKTSIEKENSKKTRRSKLKELMTWSSCLSECPYIPRRKRSPKKGKGIQHAGQGEERGGHDRDIGWQKQEGINSREEVNTIRSAFLWLLWMFRTIDETETSYFWRDKDSKSKWHLLYHLMVMKNNSRINLFLRIDVSFRAWKESLSNCLNSEWRSWWAAFVWYRKGWKSRP